MYSTAESLSIIIIACGIYFFLTPDLGVGLQGLGALDISSLTYDTLKEHFFLDSIEYNSQSGIGGNALYGHVLLFLSLTLDGVTGALQSELITPVKVEAIQENIAKSRWDGNNTDTINNKNNGIVNGNGSSNTITSISQLSQPTAHEWMLGQSIWSLVFALALCISPSSGSSIDSGQGLAFCLNENNILAKYYLLGAIGASAIGQIFVFYTLIHFSPVVLAGISSFRKIVGLALLCFIYSHGLKFALHEITGIALLFFGLAINTITALT